MLKNTFIHIPGLGIKSEQRIWSSGISSWDDLPCKGFNCFCCQCSGEGHIVFEIEKIPAPILEEFRK